MSKDELIAQCIDKDNQIDVYNSQIKKYQVLTKTDINVKAIKHYEF